MALKNMFKFELLKPLPTSSKHDQILALEAISKTASFEPRLAQGTTGDEPVTYRTAADCLHLPQMFIGFKS
jgi:hypothetical protein